MDTSIPANFLGPDIIKLRDTVIDIITNKIGDKLLPAAGALCIIVIIWGGIQYITGGTKGEETGKKTILAAIIGLILIILSAIIIQTIVGLFQNA